MRRGRDAVYAHGESPDMLLVTHAARVRTTQAFSVQRTANPILVPRYPLLCICTERCGRAVKCGLGRLLGLTWD